MSGREAGRYYPGLDGVRALALLSVLAFHDGRLRGGFLGVSAFFTLSGFLITGILLREPLLSLGGFYARRARRLLPAAVGGIVLAALVTRAVGDPSAAHAFRGDALAALGNLSNWRFVVVGRSYAQQFAQPSALLHYWSLSVEEQFYLILAPLLILAVALARKRRAAIAALIGTLGAVSFVVGTQLSVDRAYYGTDARAVEFLVGSLLAVAYGRRAVPSRLVKFGGPAALIFLVGAATIARVTDVLLFRGGLLVHALVVGVLIVAACEPGPIRSALSLRPLRAIGRVSYGAYVYHWPLFLLLTPERTGLAPLPLTAVRLGATFAIAAASYVLIERPVLERRLVVGRVRWIAAPTALLTAVVAALAITAPAAAPAIHFEPVGHVSATAPTTTRAPTTRSSTTRPSATRPALVPKRLMIIGDSVALTLGRGIERWGMQHAVTVLNGGVLGCTLLYDVTVRGYWGVATKPDDPCHSRHWPQVIASFHPDAIVVLFGAWEVYDASWDNGRTWATQGSPAWDAGYHRTLDPAAAELAASGAHVLWLNPPCFAAHPGGGGGPDAPWYQPARVDALAHVYGDVARRDGFAISDVLHRTGCPVDMALRSDGVHYSDPAADAAAAALAPELERALGR